ncbi:MAG: hypothetical protein J6B45_01640 [Clostridia bacterium]|nr:hypothetical protein [Clostridia bacterium]
MEANTRYYDPQTGRFINIDDVSYIEPENINGLNLYAYCGNDPVNRFDVAHFNGNPYWVVSSARIGKLKFLYLF